MATECRICADIDHFLRSPCELATGPENRVLDLGPGVKLIEPLPECTSHQALIRAALRSQVDQKDEEITTVAQRIEHVRIKQHSVTLAYMISIQHFGEEEADFTPYSLYPVKEARDAPGILGGLVLRYPWIDRGLFKKWKTDCNQLHGSFCTRPMNRHLSTIRPDWVVDVQAMCLIQMGSEMPYVALSYVWGRQPTFKTTSRTISEVQRPRAIARLDVGQTIRDAIDVVSDLEERYLWVDALCIVQDDTSQQHSEMAKMAGIYANATVTILALQGEHSNSPLKGINTPRNVIQSVHYTTDGNRLVLFPRTRDDGELGLKNCIWGSRGWTYQEGYFGNRTLTFDAESVRWECPAQKWREHLDQPDVCLKGLPFPDKMQTLPQAGLPHHGLLWSVIGALNQRSFTYPEDILLAFDGMAFAMSANFHGAFVSGLPVSFFDYYLLWQPVSNVRRRIAKDPQKQWQLPTWSWAGWDGWPEEAIFPDYEGVGGFPSGERLRSTVSWKYHLEKTGPGFRIQSSFQSSRNAWLARTIDLKECPGWFEIPIPAADEEINLPPDPKLPRTDRFYKHDAYSHSTFWYPVPIYGYQCTRAILAPYLSCTTRRAWFIPGDWMEPDFRGCRPISLTVNNSWAGTLHPDEDLESLEEGLEHPRAAIELIELSLAICRGESADHRPREQSEGYCSERPQTIDTWYEFYWAMWIEWEDGIAYRRGTGKIAKDIWEDQRSELFDLMLG